MASIFPRTMALVLTLALLLPAVRPQSSNQPICHICGFGELMDITMAQVEIFPPDMAPLTCDQFREIGLRGQIEPYHCRILPEFVFHACGCQVGPGQIIDPTSDGNATCWNDLTKLNLLEVNENVTNYDEPRTYVLCPNTDFEIGNETDGMSPLFPRPNQRIQCGQDGRSSNNCRLRSGSFQLAVDSSGTFSNIPNITIQGLTFDGAAETSVVLTSPGSIQFIDCVFQNHKNQGFIVGEVPIDQTQADKPIADVADQFKLFVEFHSCTFQNNALGTTSSMPLRPGIITVKGPLSPISVDRCLFLNNDFSGTERSRAISSESALSITNSCFTDNKFSESIVRVISTAGAGNFRSESNIVNHNQPNCHVLFLQAGDEEGEGECEPFSSPSEFCVATMQPDAPTSSPAGQKTQKPTISKSGSTIFGTSTTIASIFAGISFLAMTLE